MLNKSNFNRFMLRNCFLLGTICAGLLYSGNARAEDVFDTVATRDAMKTWQTLSNHGKYTLSKTSTGIIGEQALNVYGTTYYFVPNEETRDMTKTVRQIVAGNLGYMTGSTIKAGSNSYIFNTSSSLSESNITITESTSSDYSYRIIQSDGTIKYYKVTGNRTSDASNSNVTSNIIGGYYENATDSFNYVLRVRDNIDKIQADFLNNTNVNSALIIDSEKSVQTVIGDFIGSKPWTNGYGGAITNYR